MPHSSGGGSHSGGSHSGGGFSGGSSSGGSSSGGSHSGGFHSNNSYHPNLEHRNIDRPMRRHRYYDDYDGYDVHRYGGGYYHRPRFRRRPYDNCRRFMYYDRYGSENYVYGDSIPKQIHLPNLIFLVILLIPCIAVGVSLAVKSVQKPGPLEPLTRQYAMPSVYVKDKVDVIDNETELNETLAEFRRKTGICPLIITIKDSSWNKKYYTLKNYAYDLYVNKFDDEQHLLILYSVPPHAKDLEFVDWSWEAMQGDDTDVILNESKFEKFQSDLQRYLCNNNISVGQAFNRAFKNSLNYLMENEDTNENYTGKLVFSIIWILVFSYLLVSSIHQYIVGKREYTEMPM